MSERADLLVAVSKLILDYRAGELRVPSPDHVERWVRQFDRESQVPILRELTHLLPQTYYTRNEVVAFLRELVTSTKLTGPDECAYWRRTHFLRIQKNGHSQEELLDLFDEALQDRCGLRTEQCGEEGGDFVYLDDVLFTGYRAGDDLSDWITAKAPDHARVRLIFVATHKFGEHKMHDRLRTLSRQKGKKLDIRVWRIRAFENRVSESANSEVLWLSETPEDKEVQKFLSTEKYPFKPRAPRTESGGIFSSEQSRRLLERVFLDAGMTIRGLCKNPSPAMRPLGFGPFGLGFGSVIVTFRNCPNNAPLAFWWGDPSASRGHPLSKWYPLFPRKTYAKDVNDVFLL